MPASPQSPGNRYQSYRLKFCSWTSVNATLVPTFGALENVSIRVLTRARSNVLSIAGSTSNALSGIATMLGNLAALTKFLSSAVDADTLCSRPVI